MKTTIQLSGLDCANCAAELERKIAKIDGVQFASLAFVTQKLSVECDNEQTLQKVIQTANAFEDVKVVENSEEKQNEPPMYAMKRNFHVKEWVMIALSAVFLLVGYLITQLFKGTTFDILQTMFYLFAYLCAGYRVLLSTMKNIAKGRIFDENFLMTIASIGAIAIGEMAEGVMVMLLYQIGEILQTLAVQSSRKSIAELMDLKSEWATLLVSSCTCECACGEHHSHEHTHECERGCCEHHEHEHHEHAHNCDCSHEHEHHYEHHYEHERVQKRVSPEEIAVGDMLLVKHGEKIPVDGVLLADFATLDTKSLTGEADLRTCKQGETLLSGYINAGSAFEMRATQPYENSAVSRILEMVENASSRKAAPEKFITKFAKIYTPLVCGLALLLAIFAPLIDGLIVENALYFKDFTRWLTTALTFLVISCPCALVISVPLTYFSGIGRAAKRGVLIKGATYLDTLAQTKIAAFDKTGTLTQGEFSIVQTTASGVSESELLQTAAALEKYSSHPIAKAFSAIETPLTVSDVEEIAGQGLRGKIEGQTVVVGTAEWLKASGITVPKTQSVNTVIFVAKAGEYLGVIEVGDTIRKQAKQAVLELKKLGFEHTVMWTGDTFNRAEKIANEVGMSAFNAALLPDDKLEKAEEWKGKGKLLYVGDGINDAPVMAVADVAVSMGKLGSAAAVEASDLVLISDDLSALPCAVKIAKKTRAIVKQNIVFSIVMKVAFMVLGACGVLPLSLAVFADVGVMLIAVCNALRLKK